MNPPLYRSFRTLLSLSSPDLFEGSPPLLSRSFRGLPPSTCGGLLCRSFSRAWAPEVGGFTGNIAAPRSAPPLVLERQCPPRRDADIPRRPSSQTSAPPQTETEISFGRMRTMVSSQFLLEAARKPMDSGGGEYWRPTRADIGVRVQVGERSGRASIFPVKPPTSGARASAEDLARDPATEIETRRIEKAGSKRGGSKRRDRNANDHLRIMNFATPAANPGSPSTLIPPENSLSNADSMFMPHC